jgi:hypothetical protein
VCEDRTTPRGVAPGHSKRVSGRAFCEEAARTDGVFASVAPTQGRSVPEIRTAFIATAASWEPSAPLIDWAWKTPTVWLDGPGRKSHPSAKPQKSIFSINCMSLSAELSYCPPITFASDTGSEGQWAVSHLVLRCQFLLDNRCSRSAQGRRTNIARWPKLDRSTRRSRTASVRAGHA